jgi:PEP-CTERM motif
VPTFYDFSLPLGSVLIESLKSSPKKASSIMKTKRARSRKSAVINNSRWVGYATAGAATALVGANAAEGAIHHVTVNQAFNNTGPASAQASNFQLDQPGDSIRFSHFATAPNLGIAYFGANVGLATAAFRGFSANGFKYASKLVYGQSIAAGPFIGGKGTLANKLGYTNSGFKNAGPDEFVAFRFNNGSGVEYGWARLTMDGTPGNTFTLVDYAWGDVGTLITVGQEAQVPEPGSLGLLALGGAGLLAWRKRRAKAAA